jgi:hypothetical protein
MLREGFISFEKSTLTISWLANAMPTGQPYRLASQNFWCHSREPGPWMLLNSLKMRDEAEPALFQIRLQCVASLHSLANRRRR